MDTACVELRFLDGTMLAIETIAVEDEVAANMYERSELDYLIYNDPLAYWNIGRIIVEYEQSSPERADYGKQTLKELARLLIRRTNRKPYETNAPGP